MREHPHLEGGSKEEALAIAEKARTEREDALILKHARNGRTEAQAQEILANLKGKARIKVLEELEFIESQGGLVGNVTPNRAQRRQAEKLARKS